jgi:hypothetical protein
MSVWIGDLMAVADERYGTGGEGKRRRKKKMQAGGADSPSEYGDPSERKRRAPQGDSPVWGEKFEREKVESGAKRKKLPPKMMGELGELDFLRKAMGMRLIVSKPWGDSYRYDFVVDTGGGCGGCRCGRRNIGWGRGDMRCMRR